LSRFIYRHEETSEKSHINAHSEERSDEPACRQAGILVFSLKNKNEILRFAQNDNRQLPFYGIPYSGTIFQMSS
jgi:hypothetical protein